jgi:cell division protein FtsL
MIRLSTFFGFLMLVLAAYGLYLVKWEVYDLKRQNTELATRILHEKEAMNVLQAEWTYLNRPERLSRLAAKYLQLQPENGQQMIDVAQLTPTAPVTGQESDGMLTSAHLASLRTASDQGF